MNKIMNWIKEQIQEFKNLCKCCPELKPKNNTNFERKLDQIFRGIIKNTSMWIIFGVVVNIITYNLYPEFSERFPAIYGWYDGWLQFGEFCFKTVLNFLYSLFTWNLKDFWFDFNIALKDLFNQFINWLSMLHF